MEPQKALRRRHAVAAARWLLLGIAAEWVSFGWSRPGDWVPDLVVGWTLIAWAHQNAPETRGFF